MNLRSREVMEPGPYPVCEGELDCSYYIRTGLCRFGYTCRFNHPANKKLAIATARTKGGYPERIGQPECQNEVECAYYLRTGQCRFGSTCKFHHPQPSNVMVSLRSSVYLPIHSPTTTGQLSFPLSRASYVPSPRWQSPSSYAPVIMPQGVISVPGWNPYTAQLVSVSSSESQHPTAGNGPHLGEAASTGTQFRSGSTPMGYYALQRDNEFPERPGQPECQFYMKTGDCKFGAVCKFHHPRDRVTTVPDCVSSPIGLPLRPALQIRGEYLSLKQDRYPLVMINIDSEL